MWIDGFQIPSCAVAGEVDGAQIHVEVFNSWLS
jgi:hypothetical protein